MSIDGVLAEQRPQHLKRDLNKHKKGHLQPCLERNTEPFTTHLNLPTKHHKPRNIVAYRAIWGALWHAVEQGWLGRLSSG